MKAKMLFTALLITVMFASCKKEGRHYEKCFPTPSSTALSTVDLLHDSVQVEWSINDGRGGLYQTSIYQVSPIRENVLMACVNGYDTGGGTVKDNSEPMFEIIIWKEAGKFKAYALKPIIQGESQYWNSMSYAEIGVTENNKTIEIVSSGMDSPFDEGVYMCAQITITKK